MELLCIPVQFVPLNEKPAHWLINHNVTADITLPQHPSLCTLSILSNLHHTLRIAHMQTLARTSSSLFLVLIPAGVFEEGQKVKRIILPCSEWSEQAVVYCTAESLTFTHDLVFLSWAWIAQQISTEATSSESRSWRCRWVRGDTVNLFTFRIIFGQTHEEWIGPLLFLC